MILAQARYYEHYQLYTFDLLFRNLAHGRNAPMANNDPTSKLPLAHLQGWHFCHRDTHREEVPR